MHFINTDSSYRQKQRHLPADIQPPIDYSKYLSGVSKSNIDEFSITAASESPAKVPASSLANKSETESDIARKVKDLNEIASLKKKYVRSKPCCQGIFKQGAPSDANGSEYGKTLGIHTDNRADCKEKKRKPR